MATETVMFNIDTLTLGELAAAEEASGLSAAKLLSVSSYRIALVVMTSLSRRGESVPSWQELMSRRVVEGSSLPLPLSADSPSAISSGSD